MLTVAVVHSLDLDRYRTSYTPALLVALVVMTAFLIAVFERAATSGQPSEEQRIQERSRKCQS
jgi:hypothetical protein